MIFDHLAFKLRRAISKHGVVGAFAAVPAKIKEGYARANGPSRHVSEIHPFDAEFGTDTSGMIWAEKLRDRNRKPNIHNTGYYASAPSLFEQAMAKLDVDLKRFTFVDLGAGKGRVLLLASNYPFQQVIGVEFVPELQEIANRNISLYQPASRQCHKVECVLSDVRDFVFPSEPLVIFMWHPFVGPVFERAIANLEQSIEQYPREVYLVYLRPEFGHVLEASQWLHKVREEYLEMSDRDFAAFRFPNRSDVCAIYSAIDKRSSS